MKKLIFVLCLGFSELLLAGNCPADRVFTHEMGETCVADIPKRIVVLEYSFLDQLALLKVSPIGYARDAMPAYLEAFVTKSTNIGSRKMPSLEKITSLKADLIIADKRLHANIYSQLSAIAPTLIRNGMRGSIEDQFATLSQVADILSKDKVAKRAIAATYEKIANSKAIAIDKTTVVGVFRPGSMSAHGNESFLGSLIESVGKTVPVKTRAGKRQYYLDLEGLAAINPQALILMCSADAQAALDEMLKNPLFRALTAVKNQNLYIVPKMLWAKGRGVLGINQILDVASDTGFLVHKPSTALNCLD